MQVKAKWTIVVVALVAVLAAAEAPKQYLDVFIVQVKPEKRADFDAIVKRMVDINRQNKGDSWLTTETAYGPGGRITFVSHRQSYAGAEQGGQAFFGALTKSLGKAGAEKLINDFNQCVENSYSEFRVRRWDLSTNPPADGAALAKLLGESRYVRTVQVHVRPGQVRAFEDLVKQVKAASERDSEAQTTLVSQAVAGQRGTVFYITALQKSLAGFDNVPTLAKVLGDEGYQSFLKTSSEVIASTETVISRFLPDQSNAPEEIAAAAPDFWHPKAELTAKATKPRAPVTNTSQTGKMEPKK